MNKSDMRSSPRIIVTMQISYELKGRVDFCEITDLSPQGIGIRVNSLLVPGDKVNIIMGDHSLPSTVVRSNGNIAGLWFRELTNAQLGYIKWLCRKSEDGNSALSEKEIINYGIKTYVLKAETEKDKGLLGMFLLALKNHCEGFIEYMPLQNGAYQVKIYDSSSSVSSFESLLMFWKADKILLN